MRFLRSDGETKNSIKDGASSNSGGIENNQFFITENILDSHPMMGDSKIIHEERSQQESEMEAVQEEIMGNNDDEEEENPDDLDVNFDFGRAKMDYFK